ncbi:mechanosensitive ion channel domain-containing protein [Vannielia litorea]|uniref:Small-conductance mechanosensitive channel n=1 Tax=Vannielia litorea TaxID=1217970 RepID=A0A1N6GST6_9RHOB|nr:mechanosensitive ion channel domain-containing protein [Vannielia litorea]SIO10630.1 Small-conductance mechanosensitive channel [Vannielia litorea]
MRIALRCLLLSLALLLTLPAAPLRAQEAGEAQPTGTIGVEESREQDAAIARRIRTILSELEGYQDVTVAVKSGIVTLRGTTLDAAKARALNDLVARVDGVVAIENEVVESTDVVERLNPAVKRFQDRIGQLVAWAPLLLIAAAAFTGVAFLGVLIARMRQPWERLAPNSFIADIYRMLIRLAFVVGGVVVALDILGATALLGTILGAAGIIGLAIGFAVKDTVENFIASIMLSIRQPFRPNDAIEINGDEGKVIRLTSRATIILSWDGNHIRIPNSTVFKSRIVNYSRNRERRFLFEIGFEGEVDMEAARALAQETVQALPFTLESPAASVWIDRLSEGGTMLKVAGWIDQTETSLLLAKGEALRQVKAALEGAGVLIPDTTYRLRLDPPIGALAPLAAAAEEAVAQQPPETVTPPQAPLVETADVGATEEKELEAMVEAERAEDGHEDDLLDDTTKVE